jgi:hypothetical protein
MAILSNSQPVVTVKKEISVSVRCPKCDSPITLNEKEVAWGNTVSCDCNNVTYWPFELSYWKRKETWVAFVVGMVTSIIGGYVVSILI